MTTRREFDPGVGRLSLATGLLPGPEPRSRSEARDLASVLTFGDPLSVTPYQLEAARRDVPRFRKSFELFRADLMRPMEPAAVAPPATEKLEVPGTVQNLRVVGRP
jgi:hypothetical protein